MSVSKNTQEYKGKRWGYDMNNLMSERTYSMIMVIASGNHTKKIEEE
jgi:hypothetical protein